MRIALPGALLAGLAATAAAVLPATASRRRIAGRRPRLRQRQHRRARTRSPRSTATPTAR